MVNTIARRLTVFALAAALSGVAATASAQSASSSKEPSKTAGRKEYERASRYYKAQEYEAALPWFQKAYELSGHRPSTIHGLAQVERALKMYDESITHYREFLATDPPESEARAVEQTVLLLEELRADKSKREKEVRDQTPAIPPRDEVQAEQPESAKVQPEVQPQRPEVAPEPSQPQPPSEPLPRVETSLPSQSTSSVYIEAPRAEERSTVLPWVVVGSGAAVTAAGIVLFVLGRSDLSTVENAPDGSPYRDVSGAADRAPVFTGLGTGLIVAGVIGAGTGIAWLIDQSGDDEGDL